MKILALGDPHGKLPKKLDSIINKNKIKLIVCIGELFPVIRQGDETGNVDLKRGEKILTRLCSYKIPIIIFKGNMFLGEKGKIYFKSLINDFNKKYKNLFYKDIGKVNILGKNFILFDMIYEKHSHYWLDKKIYSKQKNKNKLTRLNKLLKENKGALLLSHAPPYGYLDKISSGKHIGSKELLDIIKKNKHSLLFVYSLKHKFIYCPRLNIQWKINLKNWKQ